MTNASTESTGGTPRNPKKGAVTKADVKSVDGQSGCSDEGAGGGKKQERHH